MEPSTLTPADLDVFYRQLDQLLATINALERRVGRSETRLMRALTTSGQFTTKRQECSWSPRVKVKASRLTQPVGRVATRHWQWQRLPHGDRARDYSHVLLVGETDNRYAGLYPVAPSEIVLFLVPIHELHRVTFRRAPGAMNLNSNPTAAKGEKRALFEKWMISAAELEEVWHIRAPDNLARALDKSVLWELSKQTGW